MSRSVEAKAPHVQYPCGQHYTPEGRQNISTPTPELLLRQTALHFYPVFNMALATKTQSQNIFAKLKQKPANKVRLLNREGRSIGVNTKCRYVSTAAQRIQHGAQSPLASTYASTARRTTVTWVSISPSCDRPTSTVRGPRHLDVAQLEHALTQEYSLAMGSTAHLQDGRQRERDQVLPIARRFRSTRNQGPQGQIHQQCGD
jgi:hypothetical protein